MFNKIKDKLKFKDFQIRKKKDIIINTKIKQRFLKARLDFKRDSLIKIGLNKFLTNKLKVKFNFLQKSLMR